MCVNVLRAKRFGLIIKYPPQPELLVCFHGEVESPLKKRLHPVIGDGGHIARHVCDDGALFPCASFSRQWLYELVVRRGRGIEWWEDN